MSSLLWRQSVFLEFAGGPNGGHLIVQLLLLLSWAAGAGWMGLVLLALRRLPELPDLLRPAYGGSGVDESTAPLPAVCVIVPACNEEAAIATTLRSLAALEGVAVEIIAVDDRSTDATGSIMDAVAAAFPPHLASRVAIRVLHVKELPADWLGKPHAMALAARQTTAKWLLFTDGDVMFRPDSLARAMRLIAAERADHLVLVPTMIFKRAGEKVMMACFHAISVWGARPWKIADPKALRDSVGIGAFNMVRREVYEAVGGYEAIRMEVLDDVCLGYRIKRAGYRQRLAFGRDLICIRWADGAMGVVRNLTKNVFAAFRYRVWLVVAACCGLAAIGLLPLLTVVLVAASNCGERWSWIVWTPVVLQSASLWLISRYYRRQNGIEPLYIASFPLGVCLVLFTILRSMAVTLRQGGVRWRGTFYSLSELRKQGGPVR